MWKILKKILRTIALWLPLCCMIVNAYAVDSIETIPLYPYITIAWDTDTASAGYVRARDNPEGLVPAVGTTEKYRTILQYQSALDKNTYYHITVKLKATDANSRSWLESKATGVITDQGGDMQAILFPANMLSPYGTQIEQSAAGNTTATIALSVDQIRNQSMTAYVGAKAYYYFTKHNTTDYTIDCVFYFNDEFFQYGWSYNASSTRYMQCYLGIMFPTVGRTELVEFSVYPVGGSDYNGKLDQIISLLQSQGGGLTQEDIKAATLAALEQHDAAEKQQGNAAINDAQNQLNNALNPYIQNLNAIKDSFNGFTTALSYSGTSCIISLPAAVNPMTNTELWTAQNIDLGSYYNQIPQALRSLIRASLSALIFYSVILEVIDTIRRITGVSDND